MELKVLRYSDSRGSTLGLLFIDGFFACYTLEDEYKAVKEYGKTRIAAGRYLIQLRCFGGHHWKYLKRFGAAFHKGMLQVMNVPLFSDILIHIGNDADDTAGCLLLGNVANNNQVKHGFIGSSTAAYLRIYPIIRDALLKGESVYITYIDEI
ncbi:DUF5675 family protein [Saccharicrinis aurantiacus]|uniref:DUF5675 family protein n=1 Tax=Saccharicrinis aurantiacus TaxID=1849719 RepID=UPI00248F841B|nr:DUF5675 family protein [Saccharicrinis aurantiacus]